MMLDIPNTQDTADNLDTARPIKDNAKYLYSLLDIPKILTDTLDIARSTEDTATSRCPTYS